MRVPGPLAAFFGAAIEDEDKDEDEDEDEDDIEAEGGSELGVKGDVVGGGDADPALEEAAATAAGVSSAAGDATGAGATTGAGSGATTTIGAGAGSGVRLC